jgi:Ser/Thr protein kinase RdoA (MazF antagonist)
MKDIEAKSLLKKNWGLEAQISALPSERDVNFKITGKKNYVLKIYPKVDASLKIKLNLQNRVLKFLEDNKVNTSPAVVPTKSKKLLINPSKNSAARLLTFHEGTAWGVKGEHTGEEIEQLGRLIATVDKNLNSMKISKEERKSLDASFIWNMLQAEKLLAWSSKITDSKVQAIVDKTLNNYKKNVLPKLKKMPMQVIHNDGNDYNIIEDKDKLVLIDFGDMIYAPKVVGAAVAAAYVGLKSNDPVKQIAQFVRGYHSVNPFSLDEVAILSSW